MNDELTPSTTTAKAKLKNLAKTATNVESEVASKSGQVVEAAKKTYGEVVDRAATAFDGFNTSPMSYIREYPLQSAVAGVVVGFLLGTAMSRRAIR